MSSKLTINAGVRYELNSVPYDKSGCRWCRTSRSTAARDRSRSCRADQAPDARGTRTTRTTWRRSSASPSTPRANGKTAIRGSYRISYQRLVSWALNVVEQRQPATALNQFLLTPRAGAIGGTDPTVRLNELLNGGRLPDQQRDVTLSLANGIPQLSAPATINRTPAPNPRRAAVRFQKVPTPFVQQWSGGIQRQLGASMMVEANYVGSRGRNLFRMLNVNQMDLNANGFVSDFLAAQRNLAATGNPNTGDPTGNLGRLYGGTIPATAFADIRNGNIGTVANCARSRHRRHRPRGRRAAGHVLPAESAVHPRRRRLHLLQHRVQRTPAPGPGTREQELAFAANYSYSKATDDNSNDTNGAGTN